MCASQCVSRVVLTGADDVRKTLEDSDGSLSQRPTEKSTPWRGTGKSTLGTREPG